MMRKFGKALALMLALVLVFSFAACGDGTTPTASSITFDKKTMTLTVGGSEKITPTTVPSDLAITWQTSNAAVATVSNGTVTAVSVGTAKISAENGETKAECTVTVEAAAVQKSITLNKTTLSLNIGMFEVLTATVVPTDLAITWSTSAEAIATVDSGKVTGVKEGTATITAANGDIKAECEVTVSKPADEFEEEINKTAVMQSELKTLETEQTFDADAGIFSLSTSASYDATAKALSMDDQKYAFVKLQLPDFAPKYDYGDKADRPGLATNSRKFIRFTASGDGGLQILGINESLELGIMMDPIMLTADSAKYQIEIPKAFKDQIVGIVIKNAAPADTGSTSALESFNIVDELDPKDLAEYMTDMYGYMPAIDNGTEPFTIGLTTGWGGFEGISRGDLSRNNIAYLDSFGAALEYDKQDEGNITNTGVSMFAKLKVPAGTKKLTYFVGHVGDPSAYRIQLFDGTDFVSLTEGSTKVNAENVDSTEGWRLTSQEYNGSDTLEVAIDSKYASQDVIIIFSAKFNNGASFGLRLNNIAFSTKDLVVPDAVSEGINITELDATTALTGAGYDFTASNGFKLEWGASYDAATGITFAGTDKPEGANANAAISAKVTLPTFKYLRLTVSGENDKNVMMRIRAIDFESKGSATILNWTTITGAAEQVLQLQAFPATFLGTVGLVIETQYTEQTSLKLTKIEFAAADRDEAGYDFTAMNYIPMQQMPEDGKFIFDAANVGKWTCFTANDDSNTKGFSNTPWLQLQSTNNTGDYSVLAAYKTTFGTATSVEVKSGNIYASAGAQGSSMIRVRAYDIETNTFINFVTAELTDENGWYNGAAGTERETYPWGGDAGKFYTNSLTVPTAIQGKEIILVLEYDREISENWNALIEHLAFS